MSGRTAAAADTSILRLCDCDTENATKVHPLLKVPICETCFINYNSGEFTVDNGNEIYCRWCGEGEGQLCLCDTCPKAFCSSCITRNFGHRELQRILSMSDRWHCYVCSPLPLNDLRKKRGWPADDNNKMAGSPDGEAIIRSKTRKGLLCYDISRGREKFEIPVVNEIDNVGAPTDFIYVNRHVTSAGILLTNNPKDMSCCTCTDNCKDPTRCECALRMSGFAYSNTGILITDKCTGIYECNERCKCHIDRCRNRVVGKGPNLRLEVFRCTDPKKGWGVRCRDPIPAGSYVADYTGELMKEIDSDIRGKALSDEYLLTLDAWGRDRALQVLYQLGLEESALYLPRDENPTISTYLEADLMKIFKVSETSTPHASSSAAAAATSENAVKNTSTNDSAEDAAEAAKDQYLKKMIKIAHNDTELVSLLCGECGPLARIKREKEAGVMRAEFSGRNRSNSSVSSTVHSYSASGNTPLKRKLHQSSSASVVAISKSNSSSSSNSTSSFNNNSSSNNITANKTNEVRRSWADEHMSAQLRAWDTARDLITDRQIEQTETDHETYVLDARWYGSVARFINHSCAPNLDKLTVFCESRDQCIPRLAFFTNVDIPAYTELCYDYGYYAGNVDGKHKVCLCGAPACRKTWY